MEKTVIKDFRLFKEARPLTRFAKTSRGGDPHGFQGGELRLEGDHPFTPPEGPVVPDLPREAANVAEVYAQLSHDIRASTWTVPDFKHAVHLTRLIDAVGLAAKTGIRQQVGDCPQ
jgi:hypothetical protein